MHALNFSYCSMSSLTIEKLQMKNGMSMHVTCYVLGNIKFAISISSKTSRSFDKNNETQLKKDKYIVIYIIRPAYLLKRKLFLRRILSSDLMNVRIIRSNGVSKSAIAFALLKNLLLFI